MYGASIAFKMIHNAERSGKKVVQNLLLARSRQRKVRTISAGNVAFYTILKSKCGVRFTGSSTVDVSTVQEPRINGTTRLSSLDETAAGFDDVGEPSPFLHYVSSCDYLTKTQPPR